jgi:hypothetical protein
MKEKIKKLQSKINIWEKSAILKKASELNNKIWKEKYKILNHKFKQEIHMKELWNSNLSQLKHKKTTKLKD